MPFETATYHSICACRHKCFSFCRTVYLCPKFLILEKIIRIGSGDGPLARWQAEYTRQLLGALGITSEWVLIEHPDALLQGDIDVAVESLSALPVPMPEGLCITAVSRRFDPSDCLLTRNAHKEVQRLFKLPEGAHVRALNTLAKAQLKDFRPDLEIGLATVADLGNLSAGQQDGWLLPAAYKEWLQPAAGDFSPLYFNPREMVPLPGQGVIAWQACKDDLPVRRLLQRIHHPEVSAATNVERRALQLIQDSAPAAFGAYCERDAQGNYHAWAMLQPKAEAPLLRGSISSSTTYRLPERLLEALR